MIPLSYSFRNLVIRRTTSLAAAAGVALVAFLFAGASMVASSIAATIERTGSPNGAIVLRKGADSELTSGIDAPDVRAIQSEASMAGESTPASAAELVGVVLLDKKGADSASNVQVRGVSSTSFAAHPGVQIVAGRAALPGTDEAIVGAAVRGRFAGLDLGESFALRDNHPVRVVGVFSAGGASLESEVWTDLRAAQTAFGREGVVSSLRVHFASPSSVRKFATAIEANQRLGVTVVDEPEYYKGQSEGTGSLLFTMGLLVAVFCAIGALLAATITLHASVDQRRKELGALRALGFTRKQVLASILLESLLLSAVGSAVGTIASLALGFVKFSILNSASWSEIVFGFKPTPAIIVSSIIIAGAMGLFGGALPAWRAACMNPAAAMRA